MARRLLPLLLLCWLSYSACNCGEGVPEGAADATGGSDSAARARDAAGPADAEQPGLDASEPGVDAGHRDASIHDASSADAMAPAADASATQDAAALADAAAPGPDASEPRLDAAAPGPDASHPGLDAGATQVHIYIDNYCNTSVVPSDIDAPLNSGLMLEFHNESVDYQADVWSSRGYGYLELDTQAVWDDPISHCDGPQPYTEYFDVSIAGGSSACPGVRLNIPCQ